MSKYVAAIDQGTTSTRCILFNHAGEIVSSGQMEHKQIYPQAGWVEHDAAEIWKRTEKVIRTARENANVQPGEIAAIGITNQRETTLVWNKHTGQPYHNAIVWMDTRTGDVCKALMGDEGQDRLRAKTGLPIATYFSGTKLRWLLENVEGLREDAEKGDALFGTMDTWVTWNLTGKHVTDPTNASRTLLMNIETLEWDDELLEILDVPRAMLPEIVSSSDLEGYGVTSPDGPFNEAIPVCGALGDQQAATVGQACFEAGEAKNTYGTGCFLILNTGKLQHSDNGLLTTVAYKFGDEPAVYALEGSVAIAGALVQWLRDNLGIIDSAPEVEELAGTVDDNGGIYFVPAFSGLYAPYWRDDARGVIVGMTRYVNKGHFARAALEATAFQSREVIEAMAKDSGVDLKQLKVDGGMIGNEMLMQFQSDILGVEVIRPKVAETTALGAAYAAGLAVGFWSGLDELRANWQQQGKWAPQMDEDKREAMYSQWKKAVTRTFDWVE